MATFLGSLFAQAITGVIVFLGLTSVWFVVTGQWPPREVLIAASIGGALSPWFWRGTRALRDATIGASSTAVSPPRSSRDP